MFFEFLKKNYFFLDFLRIFLFVNIEPHGGENFSSYKSQLKAFKLFLNFLPNGSHKTAFGIFEIMKIEILTFFFFVFVTMRPNGSENLTLLLQIATESFQTFLKFLPNGPHKTTFEIFEI